MSNVNTNISVNVGKVLIISHEGFCLWSFCSSRWFEVGMTLE